MKRPCNYESNNISKRKRYCLTENIWQITQQLIRRKQLARNGLILFLEAYPNIFLD